MDCNGLIAGMYIIVDEEEEVEIDPSFYQYHHRPPRASSHHNRNTHSDSDDYDPTRSSAPSPRLATPPTPGAPPVSPIGSSHHDMSERMREDVESTGGLRRTFRMSKEEFREATRNLFPESNGQRTRNPPSRTASADTGVAMRSPARLERATDRKGTLDMSVKETNGGGSSGGSGSGSGSDSDSSKGRKLEERRGRTEERRGRPEERRGKAEDKEKTEERSTRTEQNKARLEDRKVNAGASRRPGQRISSSSGNYDSKERSRGIH